jgi:hypothetical protein
VLKGFRVAKIDRAGIYTHVSRNIHVSSMRDILLSKSAFMF